MSPSRIPRVPSLRSRRAARMSFDVSQQLISASISLNNAANDGECDSCGGSFSKVSVTRSFSPARQ